MPFMPNPLRPGPLNMAQDIMNYTTNPHIEPVYSPITGRDTIGHPIRDQVFERDTIGQPIYGSRVTGRTTIGHPITTPVKNLGRTPIYGADNLGEKILFESLSLRVVHQFQFDHITRPVYDNPFLMALMK